MTEFYSGQRLTAQQLNELTREASQGVFSNNCYSYGRMIDLPSTIDGRQMFRAPRYLDVKYMQARYKFDGEPGYIWQHAYICLGTTEQTYVKFNNDYLAAHFTDDGLSAVYAMMFFGDGKPSYDVVEVITPQDLDINTDLNTRGMNSYNFNYSPMTNYDGFVETPITPNSSIYLMLLGALDEDGMMIGHVVLILGMNIPNAIFSKARVQALVDELNNAKPYGDKTVDKITVLAYSDQIVQAPASLSASFLRNRWPSDIPQYSFVQLKREPWEADATKGLIHNTTCQIGTRQVPCRHWEDSDYNMHELSGDESELSLFTGITYCVADVVNLSCYAAQYDEKDHPISASSNFNEAFQVPVKIFTFMPLSASGSLSSSALENTFLDYTSRYPIVPCWESYEI